jgi:hypothetical protein
VLNCVYIFIIEVYHLPVGVYYIHIYMYIYASYNIKHYIRERQLIFICPQQ